MALLSRLARLAVAAGLTAYILWKSHPGEVLAVVANADWRPLLLAVALVVIDRVSPLSPNVMLALTQAAWPGNVRELQHYLERAVVTATGFELSCKDIAAMESGSAGHDLRTVARGATRQAERARILQALQQTRSNRAKAAKLLKISRASLYNKIRDYQIE